MNSKTTDRFRKCYSELPDNIKKQAQEAYKLLRDDPYHPSLHFKRIHSNRPIFSVRISRDYRATDLLKDQEIIRFWIGSHAEYEKIVKIARSS